MREEEVKPHMRVCSRHFPDGDASKPPVVALGKRFCSPIKKDSRAKRAKVREERISTVLLLVEIEACTGLTKACTGLTNSGAKQLS